MGKQIRVSDTTARMLDALKHDGQSYDAVIADIAEDRLPLSDQAIESINRGMEQAKEGKATPWRTVKEEIAQD